MDDEKYYYLAFSYCLGIGPVKFSLLLQSFGSAKNAYTAPLQDIQNIVGTITGEKLQEFRSRNNPFSLWEQLIKRGITVVPQFDLRYSELLRNISDPPICLYIKGDINQFDIQKQICVAIVGTRKLTPYGQKVTELFSRTLTEAGVCIVSGMALGADTVAHTACLDAKGKTIAVLGCGVDIVYPPSNQRLYDRIIHEGGIIMSEFPPGRTVLRGLFVSRNRIVSGLSKGIFISEGAKDSGALITARYAGEQGRDVYAAPGPITSQLSEAPNLLLKQGAKLVTTPQDILEDLHLKGKNGTNTNSIHQLVGTQKEVVILLQKQDTSIDDIAISLQVSMMETLNILSLLELKGVIQKNNDGTYGLCV